MFIKSEKTAMQFIKTAIYSGLIEVLNGRYHVVHDDNYFMNNDNTIAKWIDNPNDFIGYNLHIVNDRQGKII
jgi:hypothetical protein